MTELAAEAAYTDARCVELFREGGNIIGELAVSGNGVPIKDPSEMTPERELVINRRVKVGGSHPTCILLSFLMPGLPRTSAS